MMKRYLVFAYPEFYPGGGWSDLVGSFNNECQAVECADAKLAQWKGGAEVIDLESGADIYVYPNHRQPA